MCLLILSLYKKKFVRFINSFKYHANYARPWITQNDKDKKNSIVTVSRDMIGKHRLSMILLCPGAGEWARLIFLVVNFFFKFKYNKSTRVFVSFPEWYERAREEGRDDKVRKTKDTWHALGVSGVTHRIPQGLSVLFVLSHVGRGAS